jgi:murein DD-endopeptidase MepM/ murein hydrolase activator NlpD
MLSVLISVIAIGGFLAAVRFGRGVGAGQYVSIVRAAVVANVAFVIVADVVGFPLAGTCAMAAIAWGISAYLMLAGRAERRRWREAARDPVVLQPPFAGSWRVAAGGPWARSNHHLVASDQRFAYDFVRTDGASFGTPILAPLDGVVAGARDGMDDREPSRRVYDERERPHGNYVAIRGERGTVFLCHLARGSVRVREGDAVRAGDEIGRCGNSGRTTIPHLHLHAQDRPEPAVDVAQGVPVAFRAGGRVRVLEAGDRLPLAAPDFAVQPAPR